MITSQNCKKQGLLPLTFVNPEAYDKIQPTDFVDLIGVEQLAEGSEITLVAKHKDGSEDKIPLTHTFNAGQIQWHRHGCVVALTSRLLALIFLPCPQICPQLDGQVQEVSDSVHSSSRFLVY